jgi:hypothetical protein
LIRRLSAALGTSEARIEAILDEAAFQYLLKHTLFEWFDPAPHEPTPARSSFASRGRPMIFRSAPDVPGFGSIQ